MATILSRPQCVKDRVPFQKYPHQVKVAGTFKRIREIKDIPFRNISVYLLGSICAQTCVDMTAAITKTNICETLCCISHDMKR